MPCGAFYDRGRSMSSESLRESISALMDDEAEQLEVRRVLHASEQDPDVRRSWERYQLARSVMHKEPWNTGIDLSAGIAAALADEPQLAVKARTSSRWKTHLGRVAVAASVAHGVPASGAPVSAAPAIAPVGAGAVLAGFSSHADQKPQPAEQVSEPSDWQEQRMGTYLRRHAENNVQSAPQLVPYARAASLENN